MENFLHELGNSRDEFSIHTDILPDETLLSAVAELETNVQMETNIQPQQPEVHLVGEPEVNRVTELQGI